MQCLHNGENVVSKENGFLYAKLGRGEFVKTYFMVQCLGSMRISKRVNQRPHIVTNKVYFVFNNVLTTSVKITES